MRSCLSLLLLLGVAFGAQPPAAAQQSQDVSPDMAWRLRVAAFKSLQTGSTIRVAAREIGIKTGTVLATGDCALTLEGSGRVPYSGIDSVWIRRNHATTGLIIGSSIGAVVAPDDPPPTKNGWSPFSARVFGATLVSITTLFETLRNLELSTTTEA